MFALFCIQTVTTMADRAANGVRPAASRLVTEASNAASAGQDDGVEHEIQSHLQAIGLYEKEALSSDEHVRVFAQRILPHLHQHLALLKSLKTGK